MKYSVITKFEFDIDAVDKVFPVKEAFIKEFGREMNLKDFTNSFLKEIGDEYGLPDDLATITLLTSEEIE